MHHAYRALSLITLLLLVLLIYQKSHDIARSDWGHDLQVSAATPNPAIQNTKSRRAQAQPGQNPSSLPGVSEISDATSTAAIDSILRDQSAGPDALAEKTRRLLELLGRLSPALQAEAAQHLVNFATDENPRALLEPLVDTAPYPDASRTPLEGAAYDILLLGLLQRADKIRLPALLQIARNSEHPRNAQALEYLQFVLETNHGPDWIQWQSSIDARLKSSAGRDATGAPPEGITSATSSGGASSVEPPRIRRSP
jgi:hypothetical protein